MNDNTVVPVDGSGAKSRRGMLTDALTWFLRLAVGGVFIFSGFVKAVDPWGTLYKTESYLEAMSLSLWPNLVLASVFLLCAAEFFIGVMLATGSLRRSSPVMAGLLMCFMLPLSLWIVVKNPVDDCGCFGDAVKLSNWATFLKNVALSVCIIWLIRFNRRCHWLVTPALQWLSMVATLLFVFVIELFGYVSQPLIDFRQYREGTALVSEDSQAYQGPTYVFIYEKDGKQVEFNETDSLPDENDGWTFIDRREIAPAAGPDAASDAGSNFRVWDKTGDEDMTEEALTAHGKEILVMIPSLSDVSPATTWKLNSLYEWSVKNDVRMIGVVSGSVPEIEEWEDLSMASYPVYTADETQIKEAVRGNPGVVCLEDGIVMWKSTLTAMNIDDFMSPETTDDIASFRTDNARILRNCVFIYLMVMAVLVFLSFSPMFGSLIRGGKARH